MLLAVIRVFVKVPESFCHTTDHCGVMLGDKCDPRQGV